MNATAYSAGFVAGVRFGYHICHRSLFRRLLVSLVLSAVLLGASAGLLWWEIDRVLAIQAEAGKVSPYQAKWEAAEKKLGVKR